jgi:hypothetical protein
MKGTRRLSFVALYEVPNKLGKKRRREERERKKVPE